MVREWNQLIDALTAGRLLGKTASITGCETSGLRMAQSRQVSNFGVVSLLLLRQPALRKVLSTLIEHVHMLNESLVIHMDDANGVVVLREEVHPAGCIAAIHGAGNRRAVSLPATCCCMSNGARCGSASATPQRHRPAQTDVSLPRGV